MKNHTTATKHKHGQMKFVFLTAFHILSCSLSAFAQPTINSIYPSTLTERVGDHVAFTVSATGSGTLTYQWYQNGNLLGNQTNAFIVLTNIQTGNGGQYVVAVTDDSGYYASNSATLNVSTNYLPLYSTNLVVLRLGDGVQTLSGATGNTIYLDQYTTNGAYISTIQIPDTSPGQSYGTGSSASIGGSTALILPATGSDAVNQGVLTLSDDQQYLAFGGYQESYPFTGSDVTTPGGSFWRGIYTVNAYGYYSLAYTNAGLYSGGGHTLRSALTLSGADFWTTGQGGSGNGVKYLNATNAGYAGNQGGNIPSIGSSLNGTRVVQIVNGNLVFSDAVASGGHGLYAASGLPEPVSKGTAASTLVLNEGGQPNDFAVSPDGATVYIADSQLFTNNVQSGGIQRWDSNGAGGYTYSYTLAPTAGTNGAQNLTVYFPTGITWGAGVTGAVIYATPSIISNRSVVSIVDNGPSSVATTLISAGPNEVLRGIRFGPPVTGGVTIGTQPQSQISFVGSTVAFTVSAGGAPPLFFQWQFNGTNISGATSSTLTLTNIQSSNAGNYSVIVSNPGYSLTSSNATLTVASAPALSPPPYTNLILFAGGHATILAGASGIAPLYYQWFSNNVPIDGATNSTYNLTNAQFSAPVSFSVIVTNIAGSTTGSVVTVTTIDPPTAPYPQAVLADNPIGYWRLNEPDDNLDDGDDGVIANDYWGGNDGIYTNVELGQLGYSQANDPTETSVFFGDYASANSDAYNIGGINFGEPTNTSIAFSVEAWVNGYLQNSDAGIITKGYGNGGEQFDLDTGSDGGETSHAFRFLVRDASGAAHAVNSSILPGNNIWHHLVGVVDEPNGTISLYIDGALIGSSSILPGSGILASTNLITIGARTSSSASIINDYQFIGRINDVAIYDYALSANQVAAHYYSAGIAPKITQDIPSSTNVNENGTITISTTANGTPPLFYQWYNLNTGLPVQDQTNNILTLTDFPFSANGTSFQLTVTNLYGSANSGAITINVNSGAPQIANPALPENIYVYSNSIYTYSGLTITGTEPFYYQWYDGNVPIPSATNNSYSLTVVSNIAVSVAISNAYGFITSNPSAIAIIAQPTPPTDALAQAILALNPIGYWPLQETNPPALPNVENNLGSLGALANAYYVDVPSNPIGRNIPGAIVGDSDPATYFSGANNSFIAAPPISSNLALVPPFTIELWAWPTNTAFGMPVAKNAYEGLNAGGNVGAGGGNLCGWSVDWARNGNTAWDLQLYHNVTGQGNAIQIFGPTSAGTTQGWQHVVFTYDGTNVNFYWNGQFITNGTASYVPDTWAPLCIGGGRLAQGTPGNQGYRLYDGLEDEVALYTNVLSADDILAHYQAGVSVSPAVPYKQLILNDNPLAYYRLDAPDYTTPAVDTYPPLVNYGSVPTIGFYPPNTLPGALSGPSNSLLSSPINGLNTAIDAGYAPQFNIIAGQPITALIWVKGYPTDGRFQSPFSHGDTSWHFGWDSSGKAHWSSGDNGGEITSAKVVNDGNWHLLAGVYTGTENLLYIDGVLDSTAPAGGTISGNASDIYLGGSPDYTNTDDEEYFSGSISEAAFFTNALTATQIQALYNTTVGITTPTISIAPSGKQLVITYTGTLLSSTNVSGPYTPVIGATSPYTVTPIGAQNFYETSSP